jgi:hypothetical protein
MRTRKMLFAISAAGLVLLAGVAYLNTAAVTAASPSTLLTGAQEVPAVISDASGNTTISVTANLTVSGDVFTEGIESTMAQIQLGAVGINGPVLVTLAQVSATRWSVPKGTKLSEAQYLSYKAGELYVNVHSAAHSDGEIRVQLAP